MLHFPVYTDTGKRGRQKERFYGKIYTYDRISFEKQQLFSSCYAMRMLADDGIIIVYVKEK